MGKILLSMMDGQTNDSWKILIAMTFLFYYLTEDPVNPKERNEIDYLSLIGRVVVVTRGNIPSNNIGGRIKSLKLPRQSKFIVKSYFLWTKICYLLCRPSSSLTDRNFPLRNIYTGNKLIRSLVNFLWKFKYSNFLNRALPNYEALYFSLFQFTRIFSSNRLRSNGRYKRIIVHDALILRITAFTHFILAARDNNIPTIASIKSWDNPYYTQFSRDASGYLTWSESMWHDVQQLHQVKIGAHHSWGPRSFYNFSSAVSNSKYEKNKRPNQLMVGYAAAFCDELMAQYEVKVIAGIAEALSAINPKIQILFRPYPIIPFSVYRSLLQQSNVKIIDIEGSSLDRYGDGREIIRFGSNIERIAYMSQCDCFLSIATSFTFEAAIYGMPIIQYFVPRNDRKSLHEINFFERLDISDHVLNYFLKYLPTANSPMELASMVLTSASDPSALKGQMDMMVDMGFPPDWSEWNKNSKSFLSNLELA